MRTKGAIDEAVHQTAKWAAKRYAGRAFLWGFLFGFGFAWVVVAAFKIKGWM